MQLQGALSLMVHRARGKIEAGLAFPVQRTARALTFTVGVRVSRPPMQIIGAYYPIRILIVIIINFVKICLIIHLIQNIFIKNIYFIIKEI
jgi:hypothetical protein